jgi:hypothetical protein
MSSKVDELLQKELDQAHAGTHQRQKGEEKRLTALKATRVRRAEQLRQLRIEQIDQQFDAVRREVRPAPSALRARPLGLPAWADCVGVQAEEEFNREKSTLQDRLYQEVVERQRRTSSKAEDMNSIRAMTRRYRQTRGDAAAAAKPINKREIKGTTTAVPLRQGEVEEDFETMTVLAEHINPTMEASFMEIEGRARDRLRPVDAVLPTRPLDGAGGKRQRRGDFDFKGKARAEVSGARITVWYEEEHGGRKMDVPYVGVVNSCDPREGLYVKFEGFPEEMLITNEDDWQWGSHSRKPPARAPR